MLNAKFIKQQYATTNIVVKSTGQIVSLLKP